MPIVEGFKQHLIAALELAAGQLGEASARRQRVSELLAYVSTEEPWLEAKSLETIGGVGYQSLIDAMADITAGFAVRWPNSDSLSRWAELAPDILADRMDQRLNEWAPDDIGARTGTLSAVGLVGSAWLTGGPDLQVGAAPIYVGTRMGGGGSGLGCQRVFRTVQPVRGCGDFGSDSHHEPRGEGHLRTASRSSRQTCARLPKSTCAQSWPWTGDRVPLAS